MSQKDHRRRFTQLKLHLQDLRDERGNKLPPLKQDLNKMQCEMFAANFRINKMHVQEAESLLNMMEGIVELAKYNGQAKQVYKRTVCINLFKNFVDYLNGELLSLEEIVDSAYQMVVTEQDRSFK